MSFNLGLAAYVWGALHQDRLLLDCLAPAVAELRRQGLVHRFWLDRLDIRGPHVLAILQVPSEAAPGIAGCLEARLGEHLKAHPSTLVLDPGRLARRHEETRGRRLCEVHGRPGFADNNTFEIFEHPPRGYPFWLSAGLAGEDELWDLLAELPLWTVGQLADWPGSPAMAAARRWVASVDRELRRAGKGPADPADYWLHHAPSLIPDLFQGMAPEEKVEALTRLAADVGDREQDLARAWEDVAAAGPVWPGIPEMIRLVAPAWPLLREINHIALKQLGVPAVLEIPMVLYAWRRRVDRRDPFGYREELP